VRKRFFARALRAFPLPVAVAGALLAPSQSRAQEWIVDLSAGHSVQEPVNAAIGATGLTLGLRHEGTPWFFLSAGAPFNSAGLPWGALGLGGRVSTRARQLAWGLDLGALAFGFSDHVLQQSGGGLAAEAMPVFALRSGPVGLEVRSGVAHYGTVYAGELGARTVHQTEAQAVLNAGMLVMTGEARYLRAAEASYPFVGGTLETRLGQVSLWAHGGTWIAPAIETPGWGIGARLRVTGATEAHLSVQQETNDPLYWNAARRSWSVGVSHRIGRTPQRMVPAPLAAQGGGGVTFRLPLEISASTPHVAGEFSGWREVPMLRTDDFWSVTLPIPAGVYRYAFRGADGAWFVPDHFPGREADGYGGFNAVLIVP
jgi:hypothetical protein